MVNGVKIYYAEYGAGPPVILLHGGLALVGASLVALCIGTYRGIEHRDYKQLT